MKMSDVKEPRNMVGRFCMIPLNKICLGDKPFEKDGAPPRSSEGATGSSRCFVHVVWHCKGYGAFLYELMQKELIGHSGGFVNFIPLHDFTSEEEKLAFDKVRFIFPHHTNKWFVAEDNIMRYGVLIDKKEAESILDIILL